VISMSLGMIGRKVGMMRLYDGGGRVRAVTAIELGPNRVTQLRTGDRDGYEAVQIGYRGDRKRLTRPARGHLRPAGVEEPLSILREFRVDDISEFSLGQELSVDRFSPGAFVDVSGISKGRGFAGGVKRWGFRGGPKTHGQSDKHRGPGSVGAGTTPGKVWKGQKMAGHMGARRKTVRGLLVVLIDRSRNLIFVQGSVPGPSGSIVTVSPAMRSALEGFDPPVLEGSVIEDVGDADAVSEATSVEEVSVSTEANDDAGIDNDDGVNDETVAEASDEADPENEQTS